MVPYSIIAAAQAAGLTPFRRDSEILTQVDLADDARVTHWHSGPYAEDGFGPDGKKRPKIRCINIPVSIGGSLRVDAEF
jgi:hypothetical protein